MVSHRFFKFHMFTADGTHLILPVVDLFKFLVQSQPMFPSPYSSGNTLLYEGEAFRSVGLPALFAERWRRLSQ